MPNITHAPEGVAKGSETELPGSRRAGVTPGVDRGAEPEAIGGRNMRAQPGGVPRAGWGHW